MKQKMKINLILIALLIIAVLTPTFAWYIQSGYLSVAIQHGSITPHEQSTFSVTYGMRQICDSQTASLLGIMPGYDFGITAPSGENGFDNNSSWYKNNSQAARAINSLTLANEIENESGVKNVIVMGGQLGSSVTSGGAGGAGGGNVEKTDPNDAKDNEIGFGDSSQIVPSTYNITQSRTNSYRLLDTTVENGDADNRISVSGNFSEIENKMVGVEVKILPKDQSNANDVIAAEAVRYALFSQKIADGDGNRVEGQIKDIFCNNSFSYYDRDLSSNASASDSSGIGTWAKAVAQNGFFEIGKNETYYLTAVIWLDGFADARAETGAFDVKVLISDYGNITTQSVQATDSSSSPTGTIQNKADLQVENLVIPEAYYSSGRVVRITKVAANAFKGNSYIQTVVIPDSVTDIGAVAFGGCLNLRKATLGNGLVKIGYKSFDSCPLTQIYLSNPYNWQIYFGHQDLSLNLKTPEEIAILFTDRTNTLSNSAYASTSSDYVRIV